jgi:hypothetical protein
MSGFYGTFPSLWCAQIEPVGSCTLCSWRLSSISNSSSIGIERGHHSCFQRSVSIISQLCHFLIQTDEGSILPSQLYRSRTRRRPIIRPSHDRFHDVWNRRLINREQSSWSISYSHPRPDRDSPRKRKRKLKQQVQLERSRKQKRQKKTLRRKQKKKEQRGGRDMRSKVNISMSTRSGVSQFALGVCICMCMYAYMSSRLHLRRRSRHRCGTGFA